MLTFAARPKSSVFGSHNANTDFSMEGDGGGGGKTSRLKRLSLMMHSPRPGHSTDSDASPMASLPPKKVQPDAKLATKKDTKTNTKRDSLPLTQIDSNVKPDPNQRFGEHGAAPEKKASISFPDELPRPPHSPAESTPTEAPPSESSFGRKSSISSVSFRRSRNPALGPFSQKESPHGLRIRNASPPPKR